MTETTSARPTMDEMLAKRGPSKMAASKTPSDALKVATGQDGTNVAADVSIETSAVATKSENLDTKVEGDSVIKASDEKDAKSKKTHMVPASKYAELRRELRDARDKIRALEAKTKEDSGYYDTGAQINAADQTDNNSVYKKYLDDKFVSSWLRIKEKLGDEPAGEVFTEFDQLCKEQEEMRPDEPRIWDIMYSQPDPGRFIIDYLEQYKDQSKYGTTPKEWKNNIRAEIEKEVADKVKNELLKKYNIRDQLPRDVVGSRAASGAEASEDRPSADYLFNKRKYERFRKQ